MKPTLAHLALAVTGPAVYSFAVVMFCFASVALIDPTGTKMADDLDPFGAPPSRLGSGLLGLVSVGLFFLGKHVVFWQSTRFDAERCAPPTSGSVTLPGNSEITERPSSATGS